jgi:2-oxoglutarate/2-oxoacid ferredoxin oxidoreductase subunit beta
VAKFSGIGCSSKSPAYFLGSRTASTACTAACRPSPPAPCWPTEPAGPGRHRRRRHRLHRNRPVHAPGAPQYPDDLHHRNNGVYGLTKGQFSATADLGSTLKTGLANDLPPFDCCALALKWGATFVARSFSGDKKQLQAISRPPSRTAASR